MDDPEDRPEPIYFPAILFDIALAVGGIVLGMAISLGLIWVLP